MNSPSAYHQLGRFVVAFQHLEESVNELIELIANTDDEVVRILANELEYSKRLNTADVLFARFISIRNNTNTAAKAEFHKLMVELRDLGERRNDLVHSRYHAWQDVHGAEGLLRTNSKLRCKKGEREQKEEELQPETFNQDIQRLTTAAAGLEVFRLQIINWLYPNSDT